MSVRCGETEDIRPADWYPGEAVFPLQLYRLTSYIQHQLIFQIWDIVHNDFLLLSEMSGMDLNRSEAPYHPGRGFRGMISYNEELYSHRVAHKLIPCSDSFAIAVRSQGFDMQERSGEVRGEGRCWDDMIMIPTAYGWLITPDVCRVCQIKLGTRFSWPPLWLLQRTGDWRAREAR